MPLYSISNGNTGWASDINQVLDVSTGKNDVGDITAFAPIAAPAAPTVAVSATAGVLTGAYKYAVALITGYWQGPTGTGILLTQGNTGGGTVSATVSPSTKQVNLTNIPIGGIGVVARIIYRTKAGGSTFYQLAQINDNTTTSWTDNVADASLVTVMPSTNTTGSRFVGDGSGLTNLSIPVTYGPETGVANAYVVTLTPAPTAYTAGMTIKFMAINANTGASTIDVNGLGVKSIKMEDGSNPAGGVIMAGAVVTVVYNGTNFQIDTNGLATHLADYATELVKGHIELATLSETATGADNTRAVHPLGLKTELSKKIFSQTFTENGTFTVPTGVNRVWISGTAAGGNGGKGGDGADSTHVGGGGGAGGGGGGIMEDYCVAVTPGEEISVTVGTGNTIFGGYRTLVKGGTGSTGSAGSSGGWTATGGAAGNGGSAGYAGGRGAGGTASGEEGTNGYAGGGGGTGGSPGTGTYVGGGAGGGGGGYGAGSAGGAGGRGGALSAVGIAGSAGKGYGAGGGGGGGGGANYATGGSGGNGAPGILIVRW